ncbi:MAG: hypothetical protein WCX30_03090 [Candidatus Paceibacterota bacterium]|jgi:hypothetical protein|nr:hypothetical protein [bacterium]
MIEKSDWNLFKQMLVFVAGIFVVDILDNLASAVLIIVVSTIFFAQYIKNKFELNQYFNEKRVDLNQLIKDTKAKITDEESPHENTKQQGLRVENQKRYSESKEHKKKIGINAQRKDFIFYLNGEKWTLWFVILACTAGLRALAILNIISFSTIAATFLVVASCLYIFRFEFNNPIDLISSKIEYNFSHQLYRAKIIFGGLLSIFLLNGLIIQQANLSVIFFAGLCATIFSIIVYLIKTLYSEDSKNARQCAIEYMTKYQKGIALQNSLSLDTMKKYLSNMKNIFNKNSSLSYKTSKLIDVIFLFKSHFTAYFWLFYQKIQPCQTGVYWLQLICLIHCY